MNKVLILLLILFTSCASHKVVYQEDVTAKAGWLESTEDNPIINVIQKHYANDDVEIIIKKKLTTDYVKVRLSKKGKEISKRTVRND
jgi:hypothetical protein